VRALNGAIMGGRPRQNFTPWIHVTPPDFDSITRNGAFCCPDGNLEIEGFELAMRDQASYTHEKSAASSRISG
jgi:hypothetical protein